MGSFNQVFLTWFFASDVFTKLKSDQYLLTGLFIQNVLGGHLKNGTI